MKKILKIQKYLLLFMMLFSALINAQEAQEPQAQPSADELAKELANPNNTRGTLNFNFDYVHYQGELPGAKSQNSFA
ncbi:hypothetical protein SAMN06265375_1031, partial [Muriicola jejuensis]